MTASEPGPDTETSGIPRQTADAVLMVRPACFGWNAQTQASNRFQREVGELAGVAQVRAAREFDVLVGALREAGVQVFVADDAPQPQCPDAVFPNNWVSLHADGTVVLYPMLAPNRRLERRLEHLVLLERAGGRGVRCLHDLTHHEARGEYLEGTGSVVFDHVARVAYAAASPRTHAAPLAALCDELGYESCLFAASDSGGVAIYHTNVMLAIGSGFVVVAAETIEASRRGDVLARLRDTGRDVVEIDAATMARYAANVLELRAADGARVLALSHAAVDALGSHLERLRGHVDRVMAVPIPTIETLGGGSVRCMLAEVFLPRRVGVLRDRARAARHGSSRTRGRSRGRC
jgi:hypothetical protein